MHPHGLVIMLAAAICLPMTAPGLVGWQEMNIRFSAADGEQGEGERWKPVCGKWGVADGEYVQSDFAANPAYSFAPHAVVSDFEYSVRLRMASVGKAMNAALVFRATDSGRFYYAQIGVKHRQIILVRATPKRQWIEITRKKGLELATERWHQVKVVALGDRIQIFLDDRCVIDARGSALSAGCVGLRAGLARVRFADPKLAGKPASLRKEWKTVDTDWTPEDVNRFQRGERIVAASGEVGAGMFPKALLLPSGEIIGVIRGGAPHLGIGGRIDLIRSADDGRTWTKPTTMFQTSRDDRGPSIGRAADGTLICMYRIYDAYDEQGKWQRDKIKQYTMVSRSHDEGQTWSKPVEVKLPGHEFVAPFQRMICLKDGTILMPAYDAKEALVVRSRDEGQTWGDVSVMRRGFNECAFLLLPDGRLLSAMRGAKGGLWTSFSADKGYTWSEPEQITEAKRYPADLLLLPNGMVLVVYGRRHPPYGIECMVSNDSGKTWGAPLTLGWTASNQDCGYPSGVVTEDGTIVVLWYAVGSTAAADLGFHCEAVRFREEDLAAALHEHE